MRPDIPKSAAEILRGYDVPQPPPSPPHTFRIDDLPNIWTLKPKAADWVVESLIPDGAITLLCGDSGVGKSTFALAMAGAIAHGQPFLGRTTRQRGVLYVDRENPDYVVQARVRSLRIAEIECFKVWGMWAENQPEGPQSLEIVRFAREHKPMIIFDSLVAFHTGSEQDATETRRYFQFFRNLAATGATILVAHHTGKASTARQYRGSSDIKASVDVAYLLESLSGTEEGIKSLRLKAFKNRLILPETLRIEYRGGQFELSGERVQTNREIIERIVEKHPGASKRDIEELAKAAGVSQQRIRELLESGVKDGWLDVEIGARGRRSYTLADVEVGVL